MKIVKVQGEGLQGIKRVTYINFGTGNLIKATLLGNGTINLELAELSGSKAVFTVTEEYDVHRIIEVLERNRIDLEKKKEPETQKTDTKPEVVNDDIIQNYNGIDGLIYYKKLKRYKMDGKKGFLSKVETDKILNV